jgi:hypothetical protein
MISKTRLPVLISLMAGLWGAASLASKPPAPLAIIRLDAYPQGTDLLTLRAEVRGHAGVFLFDTGEGVSSVTPSFAQTVGCTPWGQITGFRMTGERLDLARCDDMVFAMQGQQLPAPIAGVLDIMAFLPPDAPKLDGSLGLDIFAGRAITLKLKQRLLIVESPASLAAITLHSRQIPIRLVRDAEGVALTVNVAVPTSRGMAWMELDSGNGGTIVIGKHLAALLKLDTETKEAQPVRFTLAGGIPVEGRARLLENMIMDGNIGARFLRDWEVTLDLSSGRAWFSPASSP